MPTRLSLGSNTAVMHERQRPERDRHRHGEVRRRERPRHDQAPRSTDEICCLDGCAVAWRQRVGGTKQDSHGQAGGEHAPAVLRREEPDLLAERQIDLMLRFYKGMP